MKCSLIVTTFNSPEFLDAVLESVSWQTKKPFEVIVADDGSAGGTREVIDRWADKIGCLLVHTFQPDRGFRLSRSRNLAILKATSDWVIITDGDCILPPNFVQRQLGLAKSRLLVFGSRKLLDATQSDEILGHDHRIEIASKHFSGRKFWRLPLGFFRRWPKRSWSSLRGFMMAASRNAFIAIEGFDESFEGWGLEDSDFAVRAMRSGLILCDSRYAVSLLHLHHPEPNKSSKSLNADKLDLIMVTKTQIQPAKSCLSAVVPA